MPLVLRLRSENRAAQRCDHEPETKAHHTLKLALYSSFDETLSPQSWSVKLEKQLENRRRPDVLLS